MTFDLLSIFKKRWIFYILGELDTNGSLTDNDTVMAFPTQNPNGSVHSFI